MGSGKDGGHGRHRPRPRGARRALTRPGPVSVSRCSRAEPNRSREAAVQSRGPAGQTRSRRLGRWSAERGEAVWKASDGAGTRGVALKTRGASANGAGTSPPQPPPQPARRPGAAGALAELCRLGSSVLALRRAVLEGLLRLLSPVPVPVRELPARGTCLLNPPRARPRRPPPGPRGRRPTATAQRAHPAVRVTCHRPPPCPVRL